MKTTIDSPSYRRTHLNDETVVVLTEVVKIVDLVVIDVLVGDGVTSYEGIASSDHDPDDSHATTPDASHLFTTSARSGHNGVHRKLLCENLHCSECSTHTRRSRQ